jgi:hypothetical protein
MCQRPVISCSFYSHHSVVPPSDLTTSKINHVPPTKIKPPDPPKNTSLLSRPSVLRPTTDPKSPSLYDSTSGRNLEPAGAPPSSLSPRRSISGPVPSAQPNTSGSITHNYLPSGLISQDKPVRIRQLQGFQHDRSTTHKQEPDSDEDEDDEDEVTDEGDEEGPVKENAEDGVERELVESRYADINK